MTRTSPLGAAIGALAVVAVLAGCDGGGSSGEVKPFLVTFVPGDGEVVSVNLRRANEVYVEDRFAAGSPFESFAAAAPREDALALDSETGTLAVVDLSNLEEIGLASVVPAAVAFAASGAVAPPAGASFLVHDAAFERLFALDAADPRSPGLSTEETLAGGAASAVADPLGAFVLLVRNEAGTIGVFDFGAPEAPLRIDSVAGTGPLASAAFASYSSDVAGALDADGGAFVLLAVAAARSGEPVSSSALPLGLDGGGGEVPVSWDSFHAIPRVAVVADSGQVVLVDAADPLAPAVLSSFDSGLAASASLAVHVSPDDRFVAVADTASGSLRFFDLVPETADPRLAGSFELGGALAPAGFAPEDDAAAFARRPLYFAGIGGSVLVLVDLSLGLGSALLSPAAAFSPLESPAVYDTKRGAVLVGLDSSGRVVRYGLYDPERGPEAITSADLGLGSASTGVHLYFRKT